eukprot:1564310-Rhodomonas_salina.2
MSGTRIAYGAIGLSACYATSSTDLAYGGSRREERRSGRREPRTVVSCYVMCGTDLAYASTADLAYASTTDLAYASTTDLAYASTTELAYTSTRRAGYERRAWLWS